MASGDVVVHPSAQHTFVLYVEGFNWILTRMLMLLCVIADGTAVLPFSYVTAINVLEMNFILFNITELVFWKLPNCFPVFRTLQLFLILHYYA